MFRLVVRNFSILTAAQIAQAVIIFFYVAFAARQLGPMLFGTYILVTTYVRVVSKIINGGIGPISFRELARQRTAPFELLSDIVSMRLMLGVAGYVALMGVLVSLGAEQSVLILSAIAATTLLAEPFNESYSAYYTAVERMAVPCIVGIISTILYCVIGVMLLLWGFGVAALFVSEVVTILVMTVLWTIAFRAKVYRFVIRARPRSWGHLVMLALPFAPIFLSNQLSRELNVILLGRLAGPIPTQQSVGYYGPAQSIINTAVNLVLGLRRVLIPPVANRLSGGHTVTHELDLALKVVVVVFVVPMLLLTSFMAPDVMSLLFGKQYEPSSVALVILGWAGALQIAAIPSETFLFSHPKYRQMQKYVLGASMPVLVNVAICMLLIGEYGFVGASIGAVVGRFAYFIVLAHYCRRELGQQVLCLREFLDAAVLLLLGYGVWYLMFTVIANSWIACIAAVILTVPLLGGFLLYLRMRLADVRNA